MKKLVDITITDEDIDWVESVLDGVTFDENRREVLKNMDSFDVQAFPGTGKTTILVAKLAILAKKWQYQNKGICVLSHTNVAREEIEKRLGNTAEGKKLLSYPHFIGTIHSFFNTFVGLPELRSKNIEINVIEDDIVLQKRLDRYPPYLLKPLSFKAQDEESIKNFFRAAAIDPIKPNIDFDKNTKTFQEIASNIEKSHKKGEFTYEETLMFADRAMNKNSLISNLISTRFQIVFIDEAQDCDDTQNNLIEKAFIKDKVIIQRFGDENQAIFHSLYGATGNKFPGENCFNITDSKRFGSRIAGFANKLSKSTALMEGKSERYNDIADNSTIFIFDKETAGNVVNEYAKLLAENFTAEEINDDNSGGCHVVGMVHKRGQSNNFPHDLSDYWGAYSSKFNKQSPNPQKFIEYVRYGKSRFDEEQNMCLYAEWFCKGIIKFLRYYCDFEISSFGNVYRNLIKIIADDDKIKDFNRDILNFSRKDISTESQWSDFVCDVEKCLSEVFKIKKTDADYFAWVDSGGNAPESNNVMNVSLPDDKKIKLTFGSIHSVKGRTHLSTLVLETFFKTFNIKSILPYMCGNRIEAKLNDTQCKRLKCHFVAFTRARALLCVAIPKENVSAEQIRKLKENGWLIKDLTVRSEN